MFLLRQGLEPKGIVASATATSEGFQGKHWEKSKQKAWYVSLKIDSIVDSEVESPLARKELKKGALGKMNWDTRISGVSIPDDVVPQLERRWREHLLHLRLAPTGGTDTDIDEPTGREGKIRLRQHKVRERDNWLREQKKAWALRKHGELKCEACDFAFADVYGPLGKEFIECHHTVLVSRFRDNHRTKLSELALVCSNCHRMLHKSGLTPITTLRALVLANRKKRRSTIRP